ncbi:MAG: lysostaphin resistance A-like protein [Gemmataceae bacterium]
MLFAVKKRAGGSLLLLALLVLAAWFLGVDFHVGADVGAAARLGLGLVLMAGSDGGLHALFAFTLGRLYLSRYRALVEYFTGQGTAALLAGSLLAGGEELVFRGVILEGLRGDLGVAGALAVSSGLFGLCHLIPRRGLWPFALWAVWEGALLGGVYVWSGSLAVVVCLHVLHDLGGFSWFAFQRRTGCLLG